MTRQYIRECNLTVEGGGSAIDLSAFRIKFRVVHHELSSPQSAIIVIYNLAPTTENRIRQEFKKVTLTGGYSGNSSTIFIGEIVQAVSGRENPVDTTFTIVAKGSDTAHNYAFVNKTLAAGHTFRDQVNACLDALKQHGVSEGFIDDLGSTKMPRARVLSGMAKDYLRQICFATGTSWSIQDDTFQIVKNSSFLANAPVVLNSATGLVGRPEQTIDGLVVRCLLNPRIRPGSRLQINESSINKALLSTAYTAEVQNSQLPDIAADGIYRVLYVDEAGDTRGGPWYTDATCLAASSTKIPIGLAQRGINTGNIEQEFSGGQS